MSTQDDKEMAYIGIGLMIMNFAVAAIFWFFRDMIMGDVADKDMTTAVIAFCFALTGVGAYLIFKKIDPRG